VAVILALLVAMAAVVNGGLSGGRVERNRYRALELLLAGRLDTKKLVFDKETATFTAPILGTTGSTSTPAMGSGQTQSGAKTRVAVQFVTEDEADRFRKDAIEAYNTAHNTQIDWTVKDARLWRTLQPFLYVGVIVLLFFIMLRVLRGAGPGGNILSFGRSRARVADRETTGVGFGDVAGIEEAKEEVGEIVQFLKDPDKFRSIGARIPRGVMLVGSPGTGKTLLAKAIAGEAGVPFYSMSGSDFVEMFVGVGASRVRDLFRQAKESSPCIIFLDEVDAVGRRRGTGLGGGHDEREQTLNQILVEMDGFDSDQGVIMIGATNRPDVLDPALLRPGRFDREIAISLPDVVGRQQILAVHAKNIRLEESADLDRVARTTPGFSGAELAALINESAIRAALHDRDTVVESDLEEARDKVRWGRQRARSPLDEEDRRITAFHEAGHAIVASVEEDAEPVHKVTIIPRGPYLGAVMQLPEKDQVHMSRRQALATLRVLYAGRAAEEQCCSDVTAGAQNDIQRATEIARRMVCEWGMSERVGPISFTEDEETFFLGREVTRSRHHSEETAREIDAEVGRILTECYEDAKKTLGERSAALERIAVALLDRETLSGGEVVALLDGPDEADES